MRLQSGLSRSKKGVVKAISASIVLGLWFSHVDEYVYRNNVEVRLLIRKAK